MSPTTWTAGSVSLRIQSGCLTSRLLCQQLACWPNVWKGKNAHSISLWWDYSCVISNKCVEIIIILLLDSPFTKKFRRIPQAKAVKGNESIFKMPCMNECMCGFSNSIV